MYKISFFWLCIFSSLLVSSYVFALSNPASETCISDWWRTYNITDGSGNQFDLCAFSEWTVCDQREYYHWTCVRMIKEYDKYNRHALSFPIIWIKSMNKSMLQYISQQIKNTLMISWSNISGVVLSIDCKPVTATRYYYSVICFSYNEWWSWHTLEQIRTFNFDRSTNKKLGMHSLFTKWRLKLLSHNLYRYFVLRLQAVEEISKQLIKNWLDPKQKTPYQKERDYLSNYKNFTIHGSGESIDAITLYFEPHQIALLTTSQWVKVAYPSMKIIR